jgi:hypothetical protein
MKRELSINVSACYLCPFGAGVVVTDSKDFDGNKPSKVCMGTAFLSDFIKAPRAFIGNEYPKQIPGWCPMRGNRFAFEVMEE